MPPPPDPPTPLPLALTPGPGLAAPPLPPPPPPPLPPVPRREPLLAAVAGFFLLATLLLVVRQTYDTTDFDDVLARIDQARRQESFAAMRRSLDELGNLDEAVSRRLAERVPGRPSADRALQE